MDEVGTGPRGTAWGSSCGDAASRQSHESITQGSLVASVVSLVETHYAEGNGLSRFVDLGAATVATPGVCGSGELSGATSEHCATNRKEGDSDARLEMQSKPPQGQMTSRPFSRDEEKRNPLWDGSGNKS